MSRLLEGKSAIVTGGSLGIGAAIAKVFGEAGANVAVNYRKHDDEARKVIEGVKACGGKGLALQADVSDFARAQEVVTEAAEAFGGIDILVCNAGVNWDGVIWKMAEEQWDKVIDINLKGYFNYCRAVSPLLKAQKSGRVINITSINGMRGKFGQSNYAAAKAGIIGLTKSMAREMGRSQVTVNAVAPGLIETDMVASMPDEAKAASLGETVFGRLGTPEDVAHVVAFLASDAARHVTGEIIKVDGGQYI